MAATPELVTTTTALARLDPQALILKAIESGAAIETIERLTALAKDIREVHAREAWYQAMAEFQRACPSIKKTKRAKIRTRSGPGYEYSFAPLDEIMSTIQPVMGPLGLSVSWRTVRLDPAQVIVVCRVSHNLGHHEESGEIAMPVVAGGDDNAGANAMQRVGIAATYAKRYALLGIIGMAPEDDDDGHTGDAGAGEAPGETTGAAISEGQVRTFWAIARGSGWDEVTVKARWPHVHEIKATDFEAVKQTLKAGPPK